MRQDSATALVPEMDTSNADSAFNQWFDQTFDDTPPPADDGLVDSTTAFDAPQPPSHAPMEDYTTPQDDDFDDEYSEDDDFDDEYEPTWFERNKWIILSVVVGIFCFVLIFAKLGGFGDSNAEEAQQAQVNAPELSADEIVNRPTDTESSRSASERPVLADKSSRDTKDNKTGSETPSARPRDIHRATNNDGSPYGSPTPSTTEAPAPVNPPAQPAQPAAPAGDPAPVQPAQPQAPTQADSQAPANTPSGDGGVSAPPVETVYQTPDR